MISWPWNRKPTERELVPPVLDIVEGETVVSSDEIRMGELFSMPPTSAGAVVNSKTAMRVAAVYACVRLISGAIAGMPKTIFERANEGRRKVEDHPLRPLLNVRPCPGWTSATFWEYIIGQMLLRGDGIAYINRNGPTPAALLPWDRDKVEIFYRKRTDPRQPLERLYRFNADDGSFVTDESDVLHIPGFGFNGLCGMSVIQWGARNGIGIAIKGEEYAGTVFGNGGQPQYAVSTEKEMTPTLQQQFVDAWMRKYGDNTAVGPSKKPLILTEGLQLQQLSLSAADAQLLESRQWQVVDIARAFGVPPFMIAEMGKATYNNTENLSVDFVKFTLAPHLIRCEQECDGKLLRREPNSFLKFKPEGLMRPDTKSRAEYFKAALGGTQHPGWMEPNEVRRLEDLPEHNDGAGLSKPTEKTDATEPEQPDS